MRSAFIQLHVSILLAGFTGIFGKLIQLAEGPLVWYRMLFTAVLLFFYLLATGKGEKLPLAGAVRVGGVGMLLALHWIFFYGSIKYANVSVGVVCFALAGLFTALFEPLIYRRRVSWRELCFSLLTLLGVYLIFHFDTRYRLGILLGVVSAALYALFALANKRVGSECSSLTMLLYEMIGGVLLLSLLGPFYLRSFPDTVLAPGPQDLVLLVLLSSLCTILMLLLLIQALRFFSAFTVSLSYNLEPVYSIVIAMLFLGEAKELGSSFYVGLALICISVLLQTLYAMRLRGGVG